MFLIPFGKSTTIVPDTTVFDFIASVTVGPSRLITLKSVRDLPIQSSHLYPDIFYECRVDFSNGQVRVEFEKGVGVLVYQCFVLFNSDLF